MVDRVVSLAPSATSIIRSLGAEDRLVAGTVHGEHDAAVIGGWLNPDIERIESLDPDLVVATDALQSEVVDELAERGYPPLHLTPRTLEDVLASIERLGRALGVPDAARTVVGDMRTGFDRLRGQSKSAEPPVVYCEEWSDPPMVAGNWIPELVEIAGGAYPFLSPGERSTEIAPETVERHDPEHIVLHICGHGTAPDSRTVLDREWDIPAIATGNVHVIDDRLLNQPAPTLVAGAEALNACLRPESEADPAVTDRGRG